MGCLNGSRAEYYLIRLGYRAGLDECLRFRTPQLIPEVQIVNKIGVLGMTCRLEPAVQAEDVVKVLSSSTKGGNLVIESLAPT